MEKMTDYPTVAQNFKEVTVVFYSIKGQPYITGFDIGRCLGFSEPRKSVNNIFDRHRDELEPHTCVIKMMSQSDNQKRAMRVYNETGCNLVSMFAQTPRAKEFRLWLARLPKEHREMKAAFQGNVSALINNVRQQDFDMMNYLSWTGFSVETLSQLCLFRRLGLTQQETSRLMGYSKDKVQEIENRLRNFGVSFLRVELRQRRRQALAEFWRQLAAAQSLGNVIDPVADTWPQAKAHPVLPEAGHE
jgi:hypothetical protein